MTNKLDEIIKAGIKPITNRELFRQRKSEAWAELRRRFDETFRRIEKRDADIQSN